MLAFWHLRVTEPASRPPLPAGIAHGLVGTAGLAVLLMALRGPERGVNTGVATFGPIAAALFAAALLTGIAVLLLRRKGLAMAIHATIAITAYVLFLAWAALG